MLTREGFTLVQAFRYKSTHIFLPMKWGFQICKICCPFAEIYLPRGLEFFKSHAPFSFRLDWREGETCNRGIELATKIWCVSRRESGGNSGAVNGGGKRDDLKLGEPGCGGEGRRFSPSSPHILIHYFLSFRFFNLVPSINFELSCLNHNPSSDSQRSAAEMDEWRDCQSSWPRSRSEWALTRLMSGLVCLLHFLFGVNFNLRNVQFSNDKWSNL